MKNSFHILSPWYLGNRFPEVELLECMLNRFSRVRFFATLWTVACQTPLSMGFSRQEYWSGLPCSPPVDLPDPGIKPASLMSPALVGGFFTTSTTWEALLDWSLNVNYLIMLNITRFSSRGPIVLFFFFFTVIRNTQQNLPSSSFLSIPFSCVKCIYYCFKIDF